MEISLGPYKVTIETHSIGLLFNFFMVREPLENLKVCEPVPLQATDMPKYIYTNSWAD
jgi:hypothetical protein